MGGEGGGGREGFGIAMREKRVSIVKMSPQFVEMGPGVTHSTTEASCLFSPQPCPFEP